MPTDILYTTTDAIRAALGVTVNEIADPQIVNLGISDQLDFSLEGVYPDHVNLKAKIDGNTATDAEKRLWKALVLFCQYEAAYIMCAQLQMLTAQKITDGDAEMQRFQKDNLDETISRILQYRNRYAGILTEGQTNSSTLLTLNHFGTAQPAYDPVTNTGTNPSPSGT